MSKIFLLLSGTSEGPRIADALIQKEFSVLTTVTTTPAAHRLFQENMPRLEVQTRGFTESSLCKFLEQKSFTALLDATHPFAVRITQTAHSVCRKKHLPYLRFERPVWKPPPRVSFFPSFAAAAEKLDKLGEKILLTIGSRQLKHFYKYHESLTLFARVLNEEVSVKQALSDGFKRERIIEGRPPYSYEENKTLLKLLKIDGLLTKSSGIAGGVKEKVTAALDLGIKVWMIQRPIFPLENTFHSISDFVQACERLTIK